MKLVVKIVGFTLTFIGIILLAYVRIYTYYGPGGPADPYLASASVREAFVSSGVVAIVVGLFLLTMSFLIWEKGLRKGTYALA